MKVSEINRHSIWPAVIAAGGAIAGGLIGSSAAGQAAKSQEKAAKIAAELQREMYYQNRKDLAPWREAGTESINQLRRLMGMGYYDTTGGQPFDANRLSELTEQRAQLQNQLVQAETGRSGIPDWQSMTKKQRRREYERRARLGLPLGVGKQYGGRPASQETINRLRNQISNIDNAIAMTQDAQGTYVPATGEGPPGYEPVPEFTESPGYQFTLSEGQRAIQNTLSAMGKNRSGAHLRAATAHAEGLASTEYDNFLNRWYRNQAEKRAAYSSQINPYLAMAGMGQTATQETARLGSGAANQMGQAALYGGQAQAAGAINQANALTGAISGGANALLYYNALRNLQQPTQTNPSAGIYNPGAAYAIGRP